VLWGVFVGVGGMGCVGVGVRKGVEEEGRFHQF
jgi:hypothetical protein